MTYPVPRESFRLIAPINAERNPFGSEKSFDIRFPKMDERSCERWSRPLEWRKSTTTGAADQVEEQCLGEIVHRMRRDDGAETKLGTETFEESVADDAEAFLDIAFRPCFRTEKRNGDRPVSTELLNECLVSF